MFITRLCLSVCALVLALVLVAYLWACIASAQSLVDKKLKPDVERARSTPVKERLTCKSAPVDTRLRLAR